MPEPTPESMIKASVLNAALHAPASAFPLFTLTYCNLRSLCHTPSQYYNGCPFDYLKFITYFRHSEIRGIGILYPNQFGCFACGDDHIVEGPSLLSGRFTLTHLFLVFSYEGLSEVLLIGLLIIVVGVFL